jgi:hypothetical protein
LLAERDSKWGASEVPQIYFNQVEKAIQGLTQAGITSDLNERQDMALYYLKASGKFDTAVREWEQRPTDRRYDKIPKLSFQRNTQKETSRTNLLQRTLKQT